MRYHPEFAKLLNKYLDAEDRSQSWLAHRLGVQPSTVGRWVNQGKRPGSPETVGRIADILNIHDQKERLALLAAAGYSYVERVEANIEVDPSDRKGEISQEQTSLAHKRECEKTATTDTGIGRLLLSIFERFLPKKEEPPAVELYPPTCGEQGINLARHRLQLSTTFGTYFTGLLERQHSFVSLKKQIECAAIREGQKALEPIQRIFWALHSAKGPRILIIAAEGGMGKSTLAARIIRCQFQEEEIDMILGDSAKVQRVNPTTGDVIKLTPGYYDITTFYKRMCSQLGLPPSSNKEALTAIRDRLEGRRAVIVVDNLETVKKGDELLRSLKAITSRDVRAIVTTRKVEGLKSLTSNQWVVHLNPLSDLAILREFLAWHIRQHQDEHPALRSLESDLKNQKRMNLLIKRTGGIPLLIQLVFSDVARYSWGYVEELPSIFGDELLNFLYESRWQELGNLGEKGLTAKNLLNWICDEQYRGNKVTSARLIQKLKETGRVDLFNSSLDLLYQRFLVINHDSHEGNFTIFPSLTEFLKKQRK